MTQPTQPTTQLTQPQPTQPHISTTMNLRGVLDEIRAARDAVHDALGGLADTAVDLEPTLRTIARDLPDIAASLRAIVAFLGSAPPPEHRRAPKFMLWIQPPDERDLVYAPPAIAAPALGALDLSSQLPVLDQGGLATCAVCAAASVVRYLTGTTPSRLALYWAARELAGAPTGEDAGTCIRDACRAAATAVIDETAWPYDGPFDSPPPPAAPAVPTGLRYLAVPQTEEAVVGCIAEGHPVVFGTSVFEFMGRETREPTLDDSALGWTAAMLVGYDAVARTFKVQWSLGEGHGIDGRTTMPFATVFDPSLSTDFWTMRRA